jgi:hypothetical protein
MMSHWDLQVASGSVIGRDHRTAGRNRQDDLRVVRTETCTVGIVADGCGSGTRSEVGASLGVRILAESICAEADKAGTASGLRWRRVQQQLLSMLDVNARLMGGNYRQTVEEYFLFTLVGVLLTDDYATFFALGDGVVIVNGKEYSLGPFEGNKPPYIGYGLLLDNIDIEPEQVSIRVIEQIPLKELRHFLIGSDGVTDLMGLAERQLPGMPDKTVGEIDSFWSDDRYFGPNDALVSRALTLIARDWPRHSPKSGLLHDDTSLIAGRRRPEPTVE